ncbi:MAG: flagellar basal-body rod protein FlgF, partial [Bradyrhizobium sp.]
MENALLVGLSRQIALRNELDIVANNIANLETTGYRSDNATFRAFLMPNASDDLFSGSDRRVSFVQQNGNWIDFSPGALQHTGNPLDVAIQGNAFLVVQTPRGERYTRDGALSINAAGQLVTLNGEPVLGDGGPITFQPGDHDVIISPQGIVTVREGNSAADSPRGKLRLVGFDNPQQLQKDGENKFVAPANVTPTPPPQGTRIEQGAIEKSNVNAVAEISRMIEITRSYTDIANILQQQSDERRTALSQL